MKTRQDKCRDVSVIHLEKGRCFSETSLQRTNAINSISNSNSHPLPFGSDIVSNALIHRIGISALQKPSSNSNEFDPLSTERGKNSPQFASQIFPPHTRGVVKNPPRVRGKTAKAVRGSAFTLVELIVVITILAILGTISLISIQNYTSSARDVKRISDVKNLQTKLVVENAKGVPMSKLIEPDAQTGTNLITIGSGAKQVNIGTAKFENLKENADSFKDPLYKKSDGSKADYMIARTEGATGSGVGYNFLQFSYREETTGANKCIGNYYKIHGDDSENLFVGTPRECNMKTDGTYIQTPNTPPPPQNQTCTLPWGGTIANGDLTPAFETSSVVFGQMCNEETRTCTNGQLSGSYTYQTCSPEGATSCTYLDTEIAHEGTMEVYSEEQISFDASYECEARKGEVSCNNGNLTGNTDYQYKTCAKGTPTNCIANPSYEKEGKTFNVPALTHGETANPKPYRDVSENHGTFRYELDVICSDGTLNGTIGGAAKQSCDSGWTGSTLCDLQIIDGVCGNGGGTNAIATTPNTNLCTTGTGSAVVNSTNTWTWSCTGQNGGTTATTCSRPRAYCATQPSYTHATFTAGTPTSSNQAWVKGASACGFTCTDNYTGTNCETPPGPPPSAYVVPNCAQGSTSFTLSGDVVHDNITGLDWQKDGGTAGPKTWADAKTYCAALTLGGYTDWRLPDVTELSSITNLCTYNPSIDTTYFTNTATARYWTSTTNALTTSAAWHVTFNGGYVYTNNKTHTQYVRCVR